MQQSHLLYSIIASAILFFDCPARAVTDIRVKGNNVNIRAAPSEKGEVVSQVSAGDVLKAVNLDGEWIEIYAPASSYVWIHKALVTGSKVTASRARLRAGPGINFSTLGKIDNGTHVNVISEFSDWLKITPPSGCTLWISRDYIEPVPPPAPPVPPKDMKPPTHPIPANQQSQNITTPPLPEKPLPSGLPLNETSKTAPVFKPAQDELPEGLSRNKLVSFKTQGNSVSRYGTLQSSFFPWGSPSKFKLIDRTEEGQTYVICYVLGNMEQLSAVVGRKMTVSGAEYWLQGSRVSVLVPKQIILRD